MPYRCLQGRKKPKYETRWTYLISEPLHLLKREATCTHTNTHIQTPHHTVFTLLHVLAVLAWHDLFIWGSLGSGKTGARTWCFLPWWRCILFADLERHWKRAATCSPFIRDDYYCSSTIVTCCDMLWHILTHSDMLHTILQYDCEYAKTDRCRALAARCCKLQDAWRCL